MSTELTLKPYKVNAPTALYRIFAENIDDAKAQAYNDYRKSYPDEVVSFEDWAQEYGGYISFDEAHAASEDSFPARFGGCISIILDEDTNEQIPAHYLEDRGEYTYYVREGSTKVERALATDVIFYMNLEADIENDVEGPKIGGMG